MAPDSNPTGAADAARRRGVWSDALPRQAAAAPAQAALRLDGTDVTDTAATGETAPAPDSSRRIGATSTAAGARSASRDSPVDGVDRPRRRLSRRRGADDRAGEHERRRRPRARWRRGAAAYVDERWESEILPALTEDAGRSRHGPRRRWTPTTPPPTSSTARHRAPAAPTASPSPAPASPGGRGRAAADRRGRRGDHEVVLQIGPAINGTALRDASGLITFDDFLNQLEYQNVATELNNRVKVDTCWPTSTPPPSRDDGRRSPAPSPPQHRRSSRSSRVELEVAVTVVDDPWLRRGGVDVVHARRGHHQGLRRHARAARASTSRSAPARSRRCSVRTAPASRR